jgi:CHAT domain-containing protein
MGLLLTCSIFYSSAATQGAIDSRDSLRIAIQKQLDMAEELLDVKSASTIDSANSLLDSVLGIVQQNFDFYDTLIVKTYNTHSRYLHASSDYDSARLIAHKALDILETIPDKHHILALYSYGILIEGCLKKHDLVNCEQYSDQRFEILDNLREPLTPLEAEQMVDGLNDRARLLVLQNKYDEAIDDLEYGLSFITEEMKGGSRLRVDLKGNIAWILAQQRKSEESDSLLIEVLELAEHAYHPKHPLVLYTIHLLGMSARRQHEYDRADSIMDIELALSEEIHGESNPVQSDIFQAKSYLLLAQAKPEEAVDYAMRAVAVNREYTGNYPTNKLMGSLENAGNVAMAAGHWEMADEIFDELLSHKHSFLNTVFGYASETQKLKYIAKYSPIIHTLLSGAVTPSGNSLGQTVLNMMLHGKGMAIDAVASEQAAAICSADPLLDSLIEERRQICGEIAGIFGSSRSDEENILQLLDELYEGKNDIETELSLNCSKMQLDYINDSLSPEAVASRIPDNSVLCEFIKFARLDITKLYEGHGPEGISYLAVILTPDTNITIIDVGDASEIDSLIEEYHDVMSGALRAHFTNESAQLYRQYIEISTRLHNRLISPLTASMVDKEIIYIATDGMLNLLPFETLTKNGERFLIEDYEIVYLTSGRDLLKEKADLSGRDAFVLADPDYMIDPSALPALAASESAPMFAYRGNTATPECLGSMFSPLPMTRHEGISVANLLNETGHYDITYLESGQAREEVLKNLSQPPDILHIATHGYFCEQAENPYLSNPLLRSGLILAGANRTIGEMKEETNSTEDGILTALEVSGLNLIGTDLVVLSACQTGIGDVQSGEGVFGLRRAFQHAGAKSVVMSMFAVPDESTSELMERFYENWLSGQSKSSALRSASLSILNERRNTGISAHPLFWGGFILVGDPD